MSEIIERIKQLYNTLEPQEDTEEVTMFDLVSAYNKNYDNKDLIGGSWIRDNIPELKDLP